MERPPLDSFLTKPKKERPPLDSFSSSTSSLKGSQALIQKYQQEAQQAEAEAARLKSPLGLAKETGKAALGMTLDPFLKAVKSGTSAFQEAIGEQPEHEYKSFITGEPQRTLQGDIAAGEKTVPGALLEGGLELASALPIGKGLKMGKQALERVAPKIAGFVEKKIAPVVSKAVSPVTNYLAKRAEKKAVSTALEAITPRTTDLTPTEYKRLLRQERIQPKTLTKPATYVLNEREKKTAVKYKDLLQGKDPVKNSIHVMDRIAMEDAEVGSFLERNNAIFNTGELRNFVKSQLEDISDVAIPESRINKLKDSIIENFTARLEKNDMKSLWEARKDFDQQIESAFSGSPSLQKNTKKAFRNAIQEYIAERTPDDVYKTKMREMTDLFNVQDRLARKAAKEKGEAWWQNWIKENPTKAKVVGVGGGLVGTGLGAKALLD